MSRFPRLLLLVPLGLFAGCGGDPTGPGAVASVSITASAPTLSAIGSTVQLTATAKDAKGRDVGSQTFTWTSSNNGVATVAGGLVTAIANGNATITAASNGVSGTFDITVQQTPNNVTITVLRDTIYALGETMQANAAVRDSRGNPIMGSSIAFNSSNPAVIGVDGSGLLTAVTEGSSIIRASAGALQVEKTIYVHQRGAGFVFVTQPAGARAGYPITTAPVVDLVDSRGNRITTDNSTVVTASIVNANGLIVAGGSKTLQGGRATFTGLVIGGAAGSQILKVSSTGITAAESAPLVVTPGDAVDIAISAGNNQTAPANTGLPVQLQAAPQDAWDNAVPNVTVNWDVVTGAGVLANTQSTSDANGIASNTLTLSKFAGQNAARASLPGAANVQVTFTATGTPNATIAGAITPPIFMERANTVGARSAGRRSVVVRPSSARAAAPVIPLAAINRPAGKQRRAAANVSQSVASSTAGTAPVAPVPGELLVVFRGDRIGAPQASANALRQQAVVTELRESIVDAVEPFADAGVVDGTIGVSPALLTARVRVASGVTESDAIARIRRDPRVLTVERNGWMSADVVRPAEIAHALNSLDRFRTSGSGSLDAHLLSPGRMLYPGGGFFPDASAYVMQSWHYNAIGLPRAWQTTTGSASVLVAVVDDGIRFDHPAMAGLLTNDGYDFVTSNFLPLCGGGSTTTSGDGNGYDPDPTIPAYRTFNSNSNCASASSTSGGHGLHVSGTIAAAASNSLGLTGVNRQVRIRPVRVLGVHGSGSFYDIAQGILYAAGLPADNGSGGVVQALEGARIISMSIGANVNGAVMQTAVTQATAAGTLVIVSAGNSGASETRYPASYPEVVSVASVGPTLTRAYYSSFHPSVDIAAPGGVTNAGQGGGFSHGVFSSTWNFINGTPTSDSWQGTSMATPHVSGVAALILAVNPGLTVEQLRARLLDYSVDIGSMGPDNQYGRGLLNARNSITQTMAPPTSLKVYLVNASTGAVVRTTTATAAGEYSFTQIEDGSYWVFAGDDDSGDNLTGLPGRRWTAFDNPASPTPVVINGADTYAVTFPYREPVEQEPNGNTGLANVLHANGYVTGLLNTIEDADVYRVRVPQAGSYTIIAQGTSGACGFALEADPMLGLYDSNGQLLQFVDDIDTDNNSLCSSITMNLAAGEYYVKVEAWSVGRYVVSMRRN